MRILYLNVSAGLGGAERSLLDIITIMHRQHPDWSLHVITAEDGPLKKRISELGVSVEVLALPEQLAKLGDSAINFSSSRAGVFGVLIDVLRRLSAIRAYARKLRQEIERIAPDVIHSNGTKMHLLLRLTGARQPAIWHIRDFAGSRRIVPVLLRLAHSARVRVVANSQAVAEDFARTIPLSSPRVIYNAVDLDYFFPREASRGLLDRLAQLPPAQRPVMRVGLIAAFGRWKGQDLFIEAAAKAVKVLGPSAVRFYIVGGPIYQTPGSQFSEGELRDMAKRFALDRITGFTGFCEDVREAYWDLDIVAQCSVRPEPFGRTIVEAMACAKPIIVARAGGAAELFSDGVDALGFAPGDSDGLASAIVRLVREPGLAKSLSERAHQTAATRFSLEVLGQQLSNLYAEAKG